MFYVIKNADKHFKFEFVNVKQNEYLKKNDFFFQVKRFCHILKPGIMITSMNKNKVLLTKLVLIV